MIYATLRGSGQRRVTLDGQRYHPMTHRIERTSQRIVRGMVSRTEMARKAKSLRWTRTALFEAPAGAGTDRGSASRIANTPLKERWIPARAYAGKKVGS
jgi:hypothetical protein